MDRLIQRADFTESGHIKRVEYPIHHSDPAHSRGQRFGGGFIGHGVLAEGIRQAFACGTPSFSCRGTREAVIIVNAVDSGYTRIEGVLGVSFPNFSRRGRHRPFNPAANRGVAAAV